MLQTGPNHGGLYSFTLTTSGLPLGIKIGCKVLNQQSKQKSLIILEVEKGCECDLIGIKVGDRLHAIGNRRINELKMNTAQVMHRLSQYSSSRPCQVTIERFLSIAHLEKLMVPDNPDVPKPIPLLHVWRLSAFDSCDQGMKSFEISRLGREVTSYSPCPPHS